MRAITALAALIVLAGIRPASARQTNQPAAGASFASAKTTHGSVARRRRTRTTSHKVTTAKRKSIHSTTRHTSRRRSVHHAAVRTVSIAANATADGSFHRVARRHRVIRTRYPLSAAGDVPEFEDPVVRQAALAALGRYYGSVVAVDPNTGRILSIVNQKLAFSSGFEPCSTIKPVIALAGLKEGVITRETMLRVGRRTSMNLTEALAHSNNEFFAELGAKLGFPTISRYAHLLGLGEKAGWDIPDEELGAFPTEPPPESRGGIGKLSSFGEGIRITPLQMAAMASALANGGSLYYLQYPRTEEQVKTFTPRLKRTIDLQPYSQDIREGMLAAVEFGTARESYTPGGELVYAKTGTCSDETEGGHLGWFVSYVSDDALHNHPKLVLVVLLRRYGYRVSGPHAAEIGGRIYRQLDMQKFFAADNRSAGTPAEANR